MILVFEKEPFSGGGTDTAGALQKVRTEDVPMTRKIKTFVMVFTDGQSGQNTLRLVSDWIVLIRRFDSSI